MYRGSGFGSYSESSELFRCLRVFWCDTRRKVKSERVRDVRGHPTFGVDKCKDDEPCEEGFDRDLLILISLSMYVVHVCVRFIYVLYVYGLCVWVVYVCTHV